MPLVRKSHSAEIVFDHEEQVKRVRVDAAPLLAEALNVDIGMIKLEDIEVFFTSSFDCGAGKSKTKAHARYKKD